MLPCVSFMVSKYTEHRVATSCEKVSFNIASEASILFIWSGQKIIKNAKKWSILTSFWKPETVLPDRLTLKGQKLVEKAEFGKFKCDILGHFQTMCQLSCPTFVCMCVVNPSRKWANGNMLVGKLTQQNYCGTSGQIMHLDNLLWVWSMDIFRLLSPWISQFPTQGFQGDFKLMIIGIATLPNSTLLTDRDSLLMAPKWVFLVLREERCRLWK